VDIVALSRYIGRTGWDKARFLMSVTMDLIGSSSYLGYLLGPGAIATETTDTVFAPLQAFYLLVAYHRWDTVPAMLAGGIEELLPGTDGIPTCTLYHVYYMRTKYAEDAGGQPALPAGPTRA
jgi:hypothetical protein